MASTTWRLRQWNNRSSRLKTNKQKQDEIYQSLSKDPNLRLREILSKICITGLSQSKFLSYLDAFVKFTLEVDGKVDEYGLTVENILCCLRVALINEAPQVRSAGLRCIRHIVRSEKDVKLLNKLLLPFLINRSLDLTIRDDAERIEAMKLIRKLLIVSPNSIDMSIARCLVAIANEGGEAKDRMLRISLATLSELGVLNPNVFILAGGVAAITRNLLECQTPKIAESLCGVLLLLLDRPETRKLAAIDLRSVAAPFCDFHYKHIWKDKTKRDERELRLNCSRLTLLTILRSWPGILHFCNPKDSTGFKAIVGVLYLKQLEVRKAVLDLLYELLGLPQPEWTDELTVALSAVDPCEPQAAWRLNDGFVAAEGRSVLPHLAQTTPSATDMHLALLLYCFLENGLLGALTEVIATSDTFISVRATVLLGELLRLIQVLLPPGCCNISPSLPLLLEYAIESKPMAIGAVTALQQLHKLMKRRPAAYSIYLDFILKSNSINKGMKKSRKPLRHKHGLKLKLQQMQQLVIRDEDDAVKETGVLSSNDAFTWNWHLINLLLNDTSSVKLELEDSSHRTFLRRLVEYYMPSKNKYSHMDLGSSRSSLIYTTTGIELIDFLVKANDSELVSVLLVPLFNDIIQTVQAISNSKSVHDCLFSPAHMLNTQSQSYFLFIGRLATSETGISILKELNTFQELEKLATTTIHDCYVKLIISSMDYSADGPCRKILEAVLTCPVESSRLYATQFLLVLLRAGVPGFSQWGIKLLVNQLEDKSKSVRLSALLTLHESCELADCLEALIEINPNLSLYGEKGISLFIRFLSTKSGFDKANAQGLVEKHIKQFDLERYVKHTEGDISDALTLHQRGEDGHYEKRCSSVKVLNKKDLFVPPHLYGQLNQHDEGFEMLLEHGMLTELIERVQLGKSSSDQEILELKAALWALGHFCTSNKGFDYVNSRGVVDNIINLAQNSLVYSIRATAFYVMGFLGTTRAGADVLFTKDWLSTRHNRHVVWPLIEEELKLTHQDFSQSDIISGENPLDSSFDVIFEDNIDEFPSLPSDTPERRVSFPKQLTLPINKRPQNVYHKRSYSESKSFELNGYERGLERVHMRHRNNSVTDSTTSGVSSCDSIGCKGVCEHTQKLSPIPSSSSLSLLLLSRPAYRNSESSHRISSQSCTNSDISTSSLGGSLQHKLSYQDLVGYNTMRSLRKYPKYEEEFRETQLGCVDKSSNFSINQTVTLIEDFKNIDLNFESVFSMQKFSLNMRRRQEDKCYRGISLPQDLPSLFPEIEDVYRRYDIYQNDSVIEPTVVGKERFLKHNFDRCMFCSRVDNPVKEFNEITDSAKIEILKNVERLANPVNKHVRQYLLESKQKEPAVFQDVCVYSEICGMLSENTYRTSTRRMLHELFLDNAFLNLYEEPVKLLGVTETEERSNSLSPNEPIQHIKTLEDLRLTYKENKFPIRQNRDKQD